MDPYFLYLKKRNLSTNIFKHLQTLQFPRNPIIINLGAHFEPEVQGYYDSTNVLEPAQFSHYESPPSFLDQS